jgi:hypothetical protein
MFYVPLTSAQTTIADPMPDVSAEIKVNAQAGCPLNDDLCGFKDGMVVLIFDETGAFDTFQITNVQESAPPAAPRRRCRSPTTRTRASQVGTHVLPRRGDRPADALRRY